MKGLAVLVLTVLLAADTPQGLGRVEMSPDRQAWRLVGYLPPGTRGIVFPALVDSAPGYVRVVFPVPACEPTSRADQ